MQTVERELNTTTFLARANVITSMRIGAIISITGSLAQSDPTLVTSAFSILSVEARHGAFFRNGAAAIPNPSPFDTSISQIWAYNVMLSFVDPNSCPALLDLTVLPAMTINSPSPLEPPPKKPSHYNNIHSRHEHPCQKRS
ncbi:hypothetical protein G7Y89_g5078 [Cudoniella acicularis]|uniref:Uncharacterized protein n=1 Tax=Cudoniella acicularis TaxID=354080 RepID=A0A8H4RN47_9HELO|nr:hypothetical protein G7Y89_g5078 [Cudoniella acicularis]